MGSTVSGGVTNSTPQVGISIHFGCVKDGRLLVPDSEWSKYRGGDRVERPTVNAVKLEESVIQRPLDSRHAVTDGGDVARAKEVARVAS